MQLKKAMAHFLRLLAQMLSALRNIRLRWMVGYIRRFCHSFFAIFVGVISLELNFNISVTFGFILCTLCADRDKYLNLA